MVENTTPATDIVIGILMEIVSVPKVTVASYFRHPFLDCFSMDLDYLPP